MRKCAKQTKVKDLIFLSLLIVPSVDHQVKRPGGIASMPAGHSLMHLPTLSRIMARITTRDDWSIPGHKGGAFTSKVPRFASSLS
jgi:hypothetical protein